MAGVAGTATILAHQGLETHWRGAKPGFAPLLGKAALRLVPSGRGRAVGLGRRIRATGGGQIRLTARVTGRRPVGPVAGDVRAARGSVGPLLIGGAGAARGGVRSVVARGVAAVLAQVLRRGTLQGFVRDAAAEGLAVLLWLAAG